MKAFRYSAIDPYGQPVHGRLEAEGLQQAIEQLQDRGYILLRVAEEFDLFGATLRGLRRSRLGDRERLVMLDHLATLVQADLDLRRALRVVEEQSESPALSRVARQVREGVESGLSLAEALERSGEFGPVFTSAVAIGEHQGTLDHSLARLVELLQYRLQVRASIRSALVYPAIVLGVMTVVMAILHFFVLPQFIAMMEGLQIELPLATRIVVSFNRFLLTYWWLIVASALAMAIGVRAAMETEGGRRWVQRFLMLLPHVGRLFHYSALADFLHTLGSSVAAGLDMAQALDIISRSHPNLLLRRYAAKLKARVEAGSPLSSGMRVFSHFFPPVVQYMTAVGEESGRTQDMLRRAADMYQRALTEQVNNLSKFVEPAIVVLLGISVGLVMAAVIVPYFQILRNL